MIPFAHIPRDWLLWSSPFAPIALASLFGEGKKPGVYALKYQDWLRWHCECLLRGEGFVPCPPMVQISPEEVAA